MDYTEYSKLYKQLVTERGRAEIGDDSARVAEIEDKINSFLKMYPKVIPPDRNPATPWTRLSAAELFRRTIKVSIDIINDISDALSQRDAMGSTQFRRRLVSIFTAPERRLYVGFWFVFLSFVLYFIDSSG
jgi:hypothetical protein